jgi:alkylated DNA nucleotide flippase Atl1
VRIAYDIEDHDRVLETLAGRLGPRVLRAPKRLDTAARELEEYFGGQRRAFDLPLDRSLSHGFRLLVQQNLPSIGYGQTRSYRQVAELVGNPQAVRAVGTACATKTCCRSETVSGSGGSNAPATRKTILANERERTSAAGPAAIPRNETNSTPAGRPAPSLARDDTGPETARS